MKKESVFIASRKEFFLNSLLWYLMTIFSGFLLCPLACYLKIKYIVSNSKIGGRSLVFTGKVTTCYYLFITNFLLTIVTLGIFYFFVKGKFIKWEIENTHFARNSFAGSSIFDYKISDYFIASVNGIIFTIFTLGIGYPQYLVMKYRIKENNRLIDGKKTEFIGEVKKAYIAFGFTILFTILTLGIYKLLKDYEVRKYIVANTILKEDDKEAHPINVIERFNEKCINNKRNTFIVYSIILFVLLVIVTLLVLFILSKVFHLF